MAKDTSKISNGVKRVLIAETLKHSGKKMRVCGWVNSARSHGKLIFIDLRDRTGILQVTFLSSLKKDVLELAQRLRPEWVVEIKGTVNQRPKGTKNPDLITGGVELVAEELKVLSEAKTLPFSVHDAGYEINEEKRLKYRYLDLRRERLRKNLLVRQDVICFMRKFLREMGFVEVETPILTKSTPEGARDFLVPARLQTGKFYALPQSPQQYKQLLMVSGIEQYFQITRCFRDEDPRADRQAEFTQLDLEMSFVGQKEILDLIEKLYASLVKKVFPRKKITKIPFPRISYKEAMKKYKSDRPDLRRNKEDVDELSFVFITDFPMFEWGEEEGRLADRSISEGRWKAVHHPFTRPQTEDIDEIKRNPEKILAFQYDFVLNGSEIGGGSLRTYKPQVLEAVFEVMGHTKQDLRKKFGHLLEAFEYGVPPHGGIAPGIDRFLAVVLNEANIREVIAFPKTGDNRDLMMDIPSEVEEKQLKELHIKVSRPKRRKQK